MKIRVSDHNYQIDFDLNNSDAAQSLDQQLPLTVEVKNYSNDEKIFYPKNKLTTANTPETDAKPGDLAYFAPWGDVVMFYQSFAAYPGLFILGKASCNQDKIERLSGEINITKI